MRRSTKTIRRTFGATVLGFTLVEAMVSMAIGGIIITAAASSVTMINKQIYYVTKSTNVDDDIKHIEEYLASMVQEAGGGVVKAGQAIRVFETAGEADELVISLPGDFDTDCQIGSFNNFASGNPTSFSIDFPKEDLDGDGVNEHCCLEGMPVNTEMTLLPAAGPAATFMVRNYVNSGSSCRITSLDFSPLDASNVAEISASLVGMVPLGGSISSVTRVRITLDPVTHTLQASWNDNGSVRTQTITDRVHDFQVSLGFDSIDGNGVLFNDGSPTDEWIGNHAADSRLTIAAADEDLRLVTIGVVVAEHHTGKHESATLLNGPTISPGDSIVRKGMTTIGVRNTNTFE